MKEIRTLICESKKKITMNIVNAVCKMLYLLDLNAILRQFSTQFYVWKWISCSIMWIELNDINTCMRHCNYWIYRWIRIESKANSQCKNFNFFFHCFIHPPTHIGGPLGNLYTWLIIFGWLSKICPTMIKISSSLFELRYHVTCSLLAHTVRCCRRPQNWFASITFLMYDCDLTENKWFRIRQIKQLLWFFNIVTVWINQFCERHHHYELHETYSGSTPSFFVINHETQKENFCHFVIFSLIIQKLVIDFRMDPSPRYRLPPPIIYININEIMHTIYSHTHNPPYMNTYKICIHQLKI